ncbi:MAG: hypothetical protein ACRETA_11520 [Gammaproteobacteria bacterium]
MIADWRRYPVIIAVVLFAVLLVPPMQHALTANMATQMLVQIPLLIAVGWLLRGALPPWLVAVTDAWNHNGITGLLLAAFAAAFWMLPRSLDAAIGEPLMIAAKFVSVPLLIGLPLGLSWPRMGFVVRGLFISELIAMFFRLGWLYMVSPIRLCNNYLLGDQQRSGEYMLIIGGVILIWVLIKLLWGHFDVPQDDTNSPRRRDMPELG